MTKTRTRRKTTKTASRTGKARGTKRRRAKQGATGGRKRGTSSRRRATMTPEMMEQNEHQRGM